MADQQKSKHCQVCNQPTLHVKQQMISGGIGCLATILTGGLFLLFWIPLMFIDFGFQPWHCHQCGTEN